MGHKILQAREQKMEKSPIPVIDLQEFANGQQEVKKLRAACEEWGCFRVTNHKVPSTLMADMKSVVRSLLDLPGDIKLRNNAGGRGYVGPTEANPLYEALGLYDFASSQAVHDFCSRLDIASPHQREVIEMYTKSVHELLMDLTKKLGESLGLAGFDSLMEWPCQIWLNKYCFTTETLGSSGVRLHTDYGFLTILQEDDNVGGLEVMDPLGNFVSIDPLFGTFVANLGDIAKAWSNGRLCNVRHRVQCKETSIRVSIAIFLLAPGKEVEAPPELVDAEHPRLYAPFTHEHYRKLRLSINKPTGEALDLLRIKS